MSERVTAAGMPELSVRLDAQGRVRRPPIAPATVRTAETEEGHVSIMWGRARRAPNGVRYEIRRDGELIKTISDRTWFIDEDANGAHAYEVRAVNGDGLRSAPMRVDRKDPAEEATDVPEGSPYAGQEQVVDPNALAAAQQAQMQAQSPAMQQAAQAQANPQALPTPQGFEQARDGTLLALRWQATPGAVSYGVWENGQRIGEVQDPVFAAHLQGADPVHIQIDAVGPDGARSAPTEPISFAGVDAAQQGGQAAAAAAANPAAARTAGGTQAALTAAQQAVAAAAGMSSG